MHLVIKCILFIRHTHNLLSACALNRVHDDWWEIEWKRTQHTWWSNKSKSNTFFFCFWLTQNSKVTHFIAYTVLGFFLCMGALHISLNSWWVWIVLSLRKMESFDFTMIFVRWLSYPLYKCKFAYHSCSYNHMHLLTRVCSSTVYKGLTSA